MGNERTLKSFDGTKLFTETSLTGDIKAITILVHGLAEHSGRYKYLTDKLNGENFGVYKFDHRGHGKSEGQRAFYSDFNELLDDINFIVELAKEENPNLPLFLIGHSMGGFGVASFGVKYPNKVDGIVISAGLTRDKKETLAAVPDDLDPHFEIPNELTDGVCSVEEVRIDYVNDPLNCKTFTAGLAQSVNKGVAWLKDKSKGFAYPVLLLHGSEDALVSYEDSLEFFSDISSQDKQVKLYGGLYHEIFNEYSKDEVIGDVLVWIKNRI